MPAFEKYYRIFFKPRWGSIAGFIREKSYGGIMTYNPRLGRVANISAAIIRLTRDCKAGNTISIVGGLSNAIPLPANFIKTDLVEPNACILPIIISTLDGKNWIINPTAAKHIAHAFPTSVHSARDILLKN